MMLSTSQRRAAALIRGTEFYRATGRKGGETTKARYGVEHFRRISGGRTSDAEVEEGWERARPIREHLLAGGSLRTAPPKLPQRTEGTAA